MTANLTREQARIRRNELLTNFERLAAMAEEIDATGILISGDLFDGIPVSALAKNTVEHVIKAHPQMAFFYLKGNHDDSLFTDSEELPANLFLFPDNWKTYQIGNVTVTGAEPTGDIYDRFRLPKKGFHVVMLHGQESDVHAYTDPETIPLGRLKNKGIDYLALGHIHSYKEDSLDGRGVYCYPGCLEGRGFDELGPHGFVLLDIDEEKLTCKRQFISFANRELHEVHVDVSGCLTTAEMVDIIRRTLYDAPVESKHLLKLVLTGQLDISCEKDLAYLETLFADEFFYLKLIDDTKLMLNEEDYRLDPTLKGAFVRLVMEASGLEDQERTEILRYGLQALSGEEIVK